MSSLCSRGATSSSIVIGRLLSAFRLVKCEKFAKSASTSFRNSDPLTQSVASNSSGPLNTMLIQDAINMSPCSSDHICCWLLLTSRPSGTGSPSTWPGRYAAESHLVKNVRSPLNTITFLFLVGMSTHLLSQL